MLPPHRHLPLTISTALEGFSGHLEHHLAAALGSKGSPNKGRLLPQRHCLNVSSTASVSIAEPLRRRFLVDRVILRSGLSVAFEYLYLKNNTKNALTSSPPVHVIRPSGAHSSVMISDDENHNHYIEDVRMRMTDCDLSCLGAAYIAPPL